MPVITQKFIYRSDLQNNPEVKYLFGDNTLRKGRGGQAKEMRGEPNAIGVATKRLPSQMENSFFSDAEHVENCRIILADLKPAFDHVRAGGVLVIPEDGLGTGLSELPTRAPMTNSYLESVLGMLRYEAAGAPE